MRRARVFQDGVQRHDCGRAQGLDEVEHVCPVAPSPDAVFVLNGHGVEGPIVDPPSRTQIIAANVSSDPTPDLGRIKAGLLGRLEGDDFPVSNRGGQVGRKCCDPTALRRVGRNESGLGNGSSPLVVQATGSSCAARLLESRTEGQAHGPFRKRGRPREGSPRTWGLTHPNPDGRMSQGASDGAGLIWSD